MLVAIKVGSQDYWVEGEYFRDNKDDHFDVENVYKDGVAVPEQWGDEIVDHFQNQHEQLCIDEYLSYAKNKESMERWEKLQEKIKNG